MRVHMYLDDLGPEDQHPNPGVRIQRGQLPDA